MERGHEYYENAVDLKLFNCFNDQVSGKMQMNANLAKLHFCHLKTIYSQNDLKLIFIFAAWVQA